MHAAAKQSRCNKISTNKNGCYRSYDNQHWCERCVSVATAVTRPAAVHLSVPVPRSAPRLPPLLLSRPHRTHPRARLLNQSCARAGSRASRDVTESPPKLRRMPPASANSTLGAPGAAKRADGAVRTRELRSAAALSA